MSRTYLFSPIGNTDPIKYFYDGSMLHICRYYKPDVVYLYLSKEMMEYHKEDNRYVRSIELLGEKLNHTFEVHIIENDQMVNVQQYDVFYKEFRSIISDIEKEKGEDDRLLVNMASGTPAMKSALLIMATLAEYRFLPIQVSTPQKKSNIEHEERQEYDVETNWELNQDNTENAENRCQEVKCMNLMRLLKQDIIKKHILSYNYKAALEVAKDIKQDLSIFAYKWLETAEARSVLDWKRMNSVLPEANGILKAVHEEDKKKVLFEYTLILDLKVKRGEYADFLRAITPLSVDLLEMVLAEFCDIDITKYYKRKAFREWDEQKMSGTEILRLAQGNYSYFRYGPVYSGALNNIIQAKCEDKLLAQRVNELVEVEHKLRNIAAHNIVSVTQEWVKERTGKTVDETIWIIKYICECVKINTRKENWASYDLMNEQILKALEE